MRRSGDVLPKRLACCLLHIANRLGEAVMPLAGSSQTMLLGRCVRDMTCRWHVHTHDAMKYAGLLACWPAAHTKVHALASQRGFQ
jgi:hypothetical protein